MWGGLFLREALRPPPQRRTETFQCWVGRGLPALEGWVPRRRSNTEATERTRGEGGTGALNQGSAQARLSEGVGRPWESGRVAGEGAGACGRRGYTYHSFLEMKDPSF